MTDNADLAATLEALDESECAVSRERARLHRRIDAMVASGTADADELDALVQREREISARRKALHKVIDEIRAQLGLPAWQPGPPAPRDPLR